MCRVSSISNSIADIMDRTADHAFDRLLLSLAKGRGWEVVVWPSKTQRANVGGCAQQGDHLAPVRCTIIYKLYITL